MKILKSKSMRNLSKVAHLGKDRARLKAYSVLFQIPCLPRWLKGKESTCQCRRSRRRRFNPWVGKMPWRKKWQLTPVFLPRKSQGLKSLMGYSPWDHKRVEQDWATKQITKRLQFNFILSSERRIHNVILVWLSILELFSRENKLQRNEYVLRLSIAKVHLVLFFFIFEEGLKFTSKRLYDG